MFVIERITPCPRIKKKEKDLAEIRSFLVSPSKRGEVHE
jgi:hypothetical protein